MPTSTTRPTELEEHDDYMDPTQAAKDIGCGVRWLKDGANKHGFPHHRFGRALKFSRQDRDAIRKLCRVPAQPAKLAAFRRETAKVATGKRSVHAASRTRNARGERSAA